MTSTNLPNYFSIFIFESLGVIQSAIDVELINELNGKKIMPIQFNAISDDKKSPLQLKDRSASAQ